MVCVPCIVVPVLLWVFHKFIYPYIEPFLPAWAKKKVTGTADGKEGVANFTEEVLKTAEGKFIKEEVDQHPVVLFSKTTCSFSNMAKKVLDEIQVNYTVEELDKRDNCAAIQDALQKVTGARTVPRVFIGGKCIGGGTETINLKSAGKLEGLLKAAGATFREKQG